MANKRGLGRGLDALLGGAQGSAAVSAPQEVALSTLTPSRYQPRVHMDETALGQLAESIRAQGVIQPIIVRSSGDGRYEIIAGERRWRAAGIAGLRSVPVIVRDVPDKTVLAMALIENLQREDLNPLEQANGLKRLVEEFHLTHEDAAQAIGSSRSHATNLLRLLALAPTLQAMLAEGRLDMGHARALLALDGARQVEIGNRIAALGLSVRQAETLVRGVLRSRSSVRRSRANPDLNRLERELSDELGTTVAIKSGHKGTGQLVIRYASLDHLDQLLGKLRR